MKHQSFYIRRSISGKITIEWVLAEIEKGQSEMTKLIESHRARGFTTNDGKWYPEATWIACLDADIRHRWECELLEITFITTVHFNP